LGGDVVVWDIIGGRELRSFRNVRSSPSVAFIPGGQTLATTDGGQVALLSVATGAQRGIFRGPEGRAVTSLAVSRDGKTLAAGMYRDSGGLSSNIQLWQLATGREVATLSGHAGHVPSVAFAPDSKTLASGSWDGTVKLWDAAIGRELFTFGQQRASPVNAVAFSPDGKTLAAGCKDGRIRLWDVAAVLPKPVAE
jgi:WD40 repeat protein